MTAPRSLDIFRVLERIRTNKEKKSETAALTYPVSRSTMLRAALAPLDFEQTHRR